LVTDRLRWELENLRAPVLATKYSVSLLHLRYYYRFQLLFYNYPQLKYIMNDEKSDDIDAKMFAAYSCVDCGQEFQTREELEEHETKHNNLSRTDRPTIDVT
jgi:hypothetical protein